MQRGRGGRRAAGSGQRQAASSFIEQVAAMVGIQIVAGVELIGRHVPGIVDNGKGGSNG